MLCVLGRLQCFGLLGAETDAGDGNGSNGRYLIETRQGMTSSVCSGTNGA